MSKRNDPRGTIRKAAVWAGIPRRDRRQHQTAGMRKVVKRFTDPQAALAAFHKLDKSAAMARHMESAEFWPNRVAYKVASAAIDLTTPNYKRLDAAKEAPTPRQLAARKAAATRKANREAKA